MENPMMPSGIYILASTKMDCDRLIIHNAKE